jgi:arsenate reductase
MSRVATRVLFLCAHNSARSQMAEGMLRGWGSDRYEAFSAGTEAVLVRPLAIEAMAELDIDISGQTSKDLASLGEQWFDVAVTVCAEAEQACPFYPRAHRQLHWSFEDPAAAVGGARQRMAAYHRVRDQILANIRAEFIGL